MPPVNDRDAELGKAVLEVFVEHQASPYESVVAMFNATAITLAHISKMSVRFTPEQLKDARRDMNDLFIKMERVCGKLQKIDPRDWHKELEAERGGPYQSELN